MTPLLRIVATTLVLGPLAAADGAPPLDVISAIDVNALTLTVQSSLSASDPATYTLTSATVVQTADRMQGTFGDLVVGDHVALTLDGTTATEVDILPAPPLATTLASSGRQGAIPGAASGDSLNQAAGEPAAGSSPRMHP